MSVMSTRRNAYSWAGGVGWVEKEDTKARDYGDFCNDSWALLISFFRWYPDIFLDVFRGPDARYDRTLIQRVLLRASARYQDYDVTGCRGIGKTTTAMESFCVAGLLWPQRKTVYTGPDYKQLAGLAKNAFLEFQNDYPTLADQWIIDSQAKADWQISTPAGAVVGITSSRGGNFTDVTADEVAQEEGTPFDFDDYDRITLNCVRINYVVNGEDDPTAVQTQQRTITTAGRRQHRAFENRKAHFQRMLTGPASGKGSAFVVDIPVEVLVLNHTRSVDWAKKRKADSSPADWLKEYRSIYAGSDKSPIVRDEVLFESRKIDVMEEHHCCKDQDCKLDPHDVKYVIGYDVSSEASQKNARCAVVVVKLTEQKDLTKRDKYLKQVVYVDDWPPPRSWVEQAQMLKQLWYQFTYPESETYIAIDARSYGKGVVEALMMDLEDDLPPLCSIDHDTYTELELPDASPVLYMVKASGGASGTNRIVGAVDNESEMIRYAETEFEHRNVELLISDKRVGVEAYKKRHRIKDDLMDARIVRPYQKTQTLILQIQNLKKVPSGSGILERRISSSIQRDDWSALKYAMRLISILEFRNLVAPTQASEWTEFLKSRTTTAASKPVELFTRGPRSRLQTPYRGGRLF